MSTDKKIPVWFAHPDGKNKSGGVKTRDIYRKGYLGKIRKKFKDRQGKSR